MTRNGKNIIFLLLKTLVLYFITNVIIWKTECFTFYVYYKSSYVLNGLNVYLYIYTYLISSNVFECIMITIKYC